MTTEESRRDFLKTLGATSITGMLAGCNQTTEENTRDRGSTTSTTSSYTDTKSTESEGPGTGTPTETVDQGPQGESGPATTEDPGVSSGPSATSDSDGPQACRKDDFQVYSGETKTVEYGNEEYRIEVIGIDEDSAAVRVNGDVGLYEEGERNKVEGGELLPDNVIETDDGEGVIEFKYTNC